jgi:hypothetical protein
MVNEKILKEKLKYLIMMESMRNFEILDFDLLIEYENVKRDTISNYDVIIKFDYLGGISGNLIDFNLKIQSVIGEMFNHLKTYIITPEGKLSKSYYGNYETTEIIYGLDFLLDEKHDFTVCFKILHDI